jgi:hypothetical protein
MKNIKQNGKITISTNYTLIVLSSELQTVIVQNKKKAFDVLHQRRARAAQELRYSALEVKYYVFGLKCLVQAPL